MRRLVYLISVLVFLRVRFRVEFCEEVIIRDSEMEVKEGCLGYIVGGV